MDIDPRLDAVHHSQFNQDGVHGTWYCSQGEGWTFYPSGPAIEHSVKVMSIHAITLKTLEILKTVSLPTCLGQNYLVIGQ